MGFPKIYKVYTNEVSVLGQENGSTYDTMSLYLISKQFL